MRQTSAAIAEWLERGRFANAPEGARPSGWPVAGLAAGRPLKAVVSLLWAPRKEAPVQPEWADSMDTSVLFGSVSRCLSHQATWKSYSLFELPRRKCTTGNVPDVFSPRNSGGPPTFQFRASQESTTIQQAASRLSIFCRTQARVRRRKSRSGCIVFAPRSQAPSRMRVHARHSVFVRCYPEALCRRALRRVEPSRGAYGAACLPEASYGGALTLPRGCAPPARLHARRALALIICNESPAFRQWTHRITRAATC